MDSANSADSDAKGGPHTGTHTGIQRPSGAAAAWQREHRAVAGAHEPGVAKPGVLEPGPLLVEAEGKGEAPFGQPARRACVFRGCAHGAGTGKTGFLYDLLYELACAGKTVVLWRRRALRALLFTPRGVFEAASLFAFDQELADAETWWAGGKGGWTAGGGESGDPGICWHCVRRRSARKEQPRWNVAIGGPPAVHPFKHGWMPALRFVH
jgi:hypothetical protein